MSYDPYQGQYQGQYQGHAPYPQQPPPYPQQPPPQAPPPQQQSWRSYENSDTLIRIVRAVTGFTTAVFLLHILFVVFEANQGNAFVAFVYGLAKTLVLGLGDVFTPDDATIGVILNYGFAALVWLIIGRVVVRALRRP